MLSKIQFMSSSNNKIIIKIKGVNEVPYNYNMG